MANVREMRCRETRTKASTRALQIHCKDAADSEGRDRIEAGRLRTSGTRRSGRKWRIGQRDRPTMGRRGNAEISSCRHSRKKAFHAKKAWEGKQGQS